MVYSGPTSRGEIIATQMTIHEFALLEIYKAMLCNGKVAGLKPTLEKAQEATAYYLQAINPNKPQVKIDPNEEDE